MKLNPRHNKKVTQKDLMASLACIALLNDNFEYESVFCADGHPKVTGQTLQSCYNDPSKIKEIISKGDLFSLTSNPETCSFYDSTLGFNRTFKTLDEMVEYYRECGCNYAYIFDYNGWNTYSIHSDAYSFVDFQLTA
jgi:hypothetical protein